MKLLILTLLVLLVVQFSFAASSKDWKVPTEINKLPNGLRVVFSEDHSSPTFAICITYGIGFRLEPEGRTGFAHLFEHMNSRCKMQDAGYKGLIKYLASQTLYPGSFILV